MLIAMCFFKNLVFINGFNMPHETPLNYFKKASFRILLVRLHDGAQGR